MNKEIKPHGLAKDMLVFVIQLKGSVSVTAEPKQEETFSHLVPCLKFQYFIQAPHVCELKQSCFGV